MLLYINYFLIFDAKERKCSKEGKKMNLRLLVVCVLMLAFCIGVLGISSAYAGETKYARWSKPHMPLKVFIEQGTTVSGYKTTFSSDVVKALRQWKSDTRGIVDFVVINDKSKADIIFAWKTKMRKEDVTEQAKGHSYIWGITKLGYPTTIYLATRHPLDDKQSLADSSVYMIALHETGHALGIWWHTRDPKDIMYPDFLIPSITSNGARMVANQNKGTLSNRDIQNLIALYNNNEVKILDKLVKGSHLQMYSQNNSVIGAIETTGTAAASVASKSTNLEIDLGNALARLKKDPNSFEAYNNIGLFYLQSNDTNAAIQSFNKAISLNPKYSKAHFNLALTYSKLNKPDLAIYEYEKFLEFEPDANNSEDIKKEISRLKTISSK